jgi:hypothetical protein
MNIYLLALSAALTAAQPAAGTPPSHAISTATVASVTAGDPVKRGAPIGKAYVVAIDEVLDNAEQYTGEPIIIEGTVNAVCPRKGCWMEIAGKKGGRGLRVTFKDYGFFVPTDSKGMKVRAEGKVMVKVLTKDEVDHYVGEGAHIKRNPDGTANEVTFVASGVELRKK